jgi:aminopeptidase N
VFRTAFLAMATIVVLGSPPAFAVDPFFPDFGNPGINVLHYDVAIAVGERPDEIEGRAVVRLRATRALASFTLDLHALDVLSVTVSGRPAAFSVAGDKLRIEPRSPVRKGREIAVAIRYAGKADPLPDPTLPGSDDTELGWIAHKGASYVVSEPVGASTWFPANDEPTDRATFRFEITVPEPLTAAANGVPGKVRDLGDRRRFTFVMDEPMTTWLAAVHVNRFEVSRRTAKSGTPVRVYATRNTTRKAVEGYMKAADMLPVFEGWFGPFPYGSYASVAVDDPSLSYALETQALSVFPSGWYGESVVAHELAHQWFGNAVAVRAWKHLWLAEGFATYVEMLWEDRDDPKAFSAAMRALHDYVAARKVGPAVVEDGSQLFTDRTYYRGALALWALELRVGTPTFRGIVRRWARDFNGRSVTTKDFVAHAARVSGDPGVTGYLNDWIYADTVPALPAEVAGMAPAGPEALPFAVPHRRR